MKHKMEFFFPPYTLLEGISHLVERYAHHASTTAQERGEGVAQEKPETAALSQKEARERALTAPFYAKTLSKPYSDVVHSIHETRRRRDGPRKKGEGHLLLLLGT